ncbi:hypothetical protein [Pseudobacillus badius]|nr:hypothetical protein [Bacillus badius]
MMTDDAGKLLEYLAILAELKRAGVQNQREVDRAIRAIEKKLDIQ